MPSLYLVPKAGAEFPYAEVKQRIAALPEVTTRPVDYDGLIKKCQDNDWPPELVDKYKKLKKNGNCVEFESGAEPAYAGTVWEENVYFTFTDEAHHARCEPFIQELAAALNLEVSIGFSE